MNWKTKQLLLALFGGISIIAFVLIFATENKILKIINLCISIWSFMTAMVLKSGVAVHG